MLPTRKQSLRDRRGFWLTLLFCAVAPALPAQRDSTVPSSPATIVFMTDFGTANDAAAICRAVMVGIAPEVRIMDITHQVTPFSIEEAARNLESVTPYYPAGTVFIVVVDPGVGTARKALIVRSRRGQYFVLPDNGIVTPVIDRDGLEGAVAITNPAWMIGARISSTFHGRDLFAPAAAHLAAGWSWTDAGPAVDTLVRFTARVATVDRAGVTGEVVALDDPYGNLITNITEAQLSGLGYALGDQVSLRLGTRRLRLPLVKTFENVPAGKPLLYIDSRGRVALAVNGGDISRTYDIHPPVALLIPRRPRH